MAPKAPPGKSPSSKNQARRGKASIKTSPGRGVQKKEKETKKQKSEPKKWLETSQDWAKFNEWAAKNSEPKKISDPEPIVRASKPLVELQDRIERLSTPRKITDSNGRDLNAVSKKALKAKASKRLKRLSKFVAKKVTTGRKFPTRVSRAALRYRPSKRITEISKPSEPRLSDACRTLIDNLDISDGKTVDKKTRAAVAKKALQCPDFMTDEELDILVTPTGIQRSALEYEFTPWMEYLALPSYRFLKDRDDEDATSWKTYILEENEVRGKKALEEKRRKEKLRKKRQAGLETSRKRKVREKTETDEEGKEPEQEENTVDVEASPTTEAEIAEGSSEEQSEEKTQENEVLEEKSDAPKIDEDVDPGKKEEVNDRAAERKAARNAWRFTPSPCKDNPFEIKRSALTGKVSPRMAELAVTRLREDHTCKADPFSVKKSALTGPIPEGVSRLAIPNHPRDPIERPEPREKDSFGRPIYPMPPYGRKLPPAKPYQEAECPDKEKKSGDDADEEKKKARKGRIDPIAYEPTIDPCFDPERSKRQIKARKAAKEEMKRLMEAEGTKGKENQAKNEKIENRSQRMTKKNDEIEGKSDVNDNESEMTGDIVAD